MALDRTNRLLLTSAALLLAAVVAKLAINGGLGVADDTLPAFDLRTVASLSIEGPLGHLRLHRQHGVWRLHSGEPADHRRVDALLLAWSPGWELGGGWAPEQPELAGLGLGADEVVSLQIDGEAGPIVRILIGQDLDGGRCVLARPDRSAAWRVVAPCHAQLPEPGRWAEDPEP